MMLLCPFTCGIRRNMAPDACRKCVGLRGCVSMILVVFLLCRQSRSEQMAVDEAGRCDYYSR